MFDVVPDVVGALLKRVVVRLVARRARVDRRLPEPVARLLGEPRVQPGAAERRRRGVVAVRRKPFDAVLAIGALEVPRARLLAQRDLARVAATRSSARRSRGRCTCGRFHVAEQVVAVHLGVARQPRRERRVDVARDAAQDAADHDVAVHEVALDAAHEIVRQRLHFLRAAHAGGVCDARVGAGR